MGWVSNRFASFRTYAWTRAPCTVTARRIVVPGAALRARETASPILAVAPSCDGSGSNRCPDTSRTSGAENDSSTAAYASSAVSPPTGTPPTVTPAAITGSGAVVVVGEVVVTPVVVSIASGRTPAGTPAASKP